MKSSRFLWTATLLLVLAPMARADVTLPSVLSSHMVLQRDKPVTLWGWADPGEEVRVTFGDNEVKTKTDNGGNWRVSLPAMKASAEGRTLAIKGKNALELSDVLVGEVWLGSGQSNMEWPMVATEKAQERIAAAKHPNIRLFQVEKLTSDRPLREVPFTGAKPSWKACTPQSVGGFSAVLYFFGTALQKDLDVPIGLINSSWGGSPIEPWTVDKKGSGNMYNAMIAPLTPYTLRGVLWYQGETNAFNRNCMAYFDKKKALISGWRNFWGQDMPFYFVQIAPWQPKNGGYPEGELMKIWEAQVATLKIPHTGMAVTTDIVHDINDIHPNNKLDVGNRLARWAMARTYGKKDVVVSGPLYKGIKVEGDKIRVSFAHTAGGLKARDDKPLTEFEIAGADGKFVAAEATVDGETVVVSASGVTNPEQVRFGWRSTANPNLVNKEGLPASPFRSKDWQGGTGE
ncbi:MAG: sialate O-acetylesterase [Gemmataceae bacterium]